ncbi:MAG: hypothetical protein ACO288_06435 [Ilumatobacteraceae bacterium]
MTTPPSTTPTSRYGPIARFDEEWQRLKHSPRALERVNSWGISPKSFSSLDELLVAAGFQGKNIDPVADAVLARLVQRASTDELAARIVLQRVIPPILSIARRRGRNRSIGYNDALGMALSHAWEVIRTYPIARRPAKIAVNIVRDIEYFAFVRTERRRPQLSPFVPDSEALLNHRSADMMTFDDPYGSATGGSTSDIELAHLLRQAQECGMSERSIELCMALGAGDIDGYAERHGVTRRTARGWSQAAINELRVRTQCVA